MTRKGFTVCLTDICNARCRICSVSAQPENSHILSEQEVFAAVDACKAEGKTTVTFTGGEPFLFYELLQSGLRYAKKLGLKTHVETNGVFGEWSDDELKEKLAALPIDELFLSTDSFHEEFIPRECAERAFNFAREAGMNASLLIGEMKSGPSAGQHFHDLSYSKLLTNTYIYPFERKGRALQFAQEDFYDGN